MAKEAILEICCSDYSEKISDIVNLLYESGWTYYNAEKKIEYLPFGDKDDYMWQNKFLSKQELQELICNKQNDLERVGLNLFYENSDTGVTLLAQNTKEILICLNINRKTIDGTKRAMTDISWYFINMVQRLEERGCKIDCIKFEEYLD